LDFTATAASVVSQAIGSELFTGKSWPDPNEGKEPKAVARGKAGGEIGGKARAEKFKALARKVSANRRRGLIVNGFCHLFCNLPIWRGVYRKGVLRASIAYDKPILLVLSVEL
jgi:hypothetical protein